jgi:hypothetical protein
VAVGVLDVADDFAEEIAVGQDLTRLYAIAVMVEFPCFEPDGVDDGWPLRLNEVEAVILNIGDGSFDWAQEAICRLCFGGRRTLGRGAANGKRAQNDDTWQQPNAIFSRTGTHYREFDPEKPRGASTNFLR